MMSRELSRFALNACVASALLAGCGGSQPPIGAAAALPQSHASSGYTTLYGFGKRSSDGQQPKAGLIELNGTLYGTTVGGGSTACIGGCGVVFTITSSGKEIVLYRFGGGNDGANPTASLVAVKGVLYGTTEYGGGLNGGTVFKIATDGKEKVLHSFGPVPDGVYPVASLTNVRGILDGTTSSGGDDAICPTYGCGTVFSVTTNGTEKVLHSFSFFRDGAIPLANLVDVSGILYGTTQSGGGYSSYSAGTVFSINSSGIEHLVFAFSYGHSDAGFPVAGLTNVDGLLYGTTPGGGPYYGGTAFSITPSGELNTIYIFGSGTDGSAPAAPLLNVKGTLFGTTSTGGTYGKGTVFSMSLTGSNEKVLHSFGHGADGATPLAGLIYVKGMLYGTTSAGGANGEGTVFALTP